MRRAFPDHRVRHRLLQAFVRRVSVAPDPDAYVLRGGMLVDAWFPAANRPVRDVDLVCRLPYALDEVRARMGAVLADPRVADGVRFDPERFRLDPLWPDSPQPGMRLRAVGRAGEGAGAETGEISVDLTFGLDVWPAAERCALAFDGGAVDAWICRPETIVGRKLRVTRDLARGNWRAKDLADLWLLSRMDHDGAALGEAIARALPDRSEAADLFDRSWWAEPHAEARWGRFHREAGRAFPIGLSQVVDEVRAFVGGRTG